MATTTNYALTLLEVGQKEKEVTINTNFQALDSVPKFLGRLAANPSTTTGTPLGSYYFNTTSSKMVFLTQITPSVIWSNAA